MRSLFAATLSLIVAVGPVAAQVVPLEGMPVRPVLPGFALSDTEDKPSPEMGPDLGENQPTPELQIVPVEDTAKIEQRKRDEAAIREGILEKLRRGQIPTQRKPGKGGPPLLNAP